MDFPALNQSEKRVFGDRNQSERRGSEASSQSGWRFSEVGEGQRSDSQSKDRIPGPMDTISQSEPGML